MRECARLQTLLLDAERNAASMRNMINMLEEGRSEVCVVGGTLRSADHMDGEVIFNLFPAIAWSPVSGGCDVGGEEPGAAAGEGDGGLGPRYPW